MTCQGPRRPAGKGKASPGAVGGTPAQSRRPEVSLLDHFVITGGRRLMGRVRVSGAKNAVLPIMAAALLTEEPCVIRDVPRLRDVAVMASILEKLGVGATFEEEGGSRIVRLTPGHLATPEVPEYLMRRMRSSIFLMGPLLGRTGQARLSYPGGCAIGPRPINLHLQGLVDLGAEIIERAGYIEARAARLRGAVIHLDQPSVGATENVMMAAVRAQGITIINHAAREPEITDLACFLNAMGARVSGAGTDVIRVEGVRRLGGAEHRVIPDRIEAGTYLVAAAITGGELLLENVVPTHLEAPIAKLREAGAMVEPDGSDLRILGPERPRAMDLRTLPYPGFPTDLQSQFMTLMAVGDGTSLISENIFENRFKVVGELRRMGAQITVDGRVAVVKGVPRLSGAAVEAMDDLRGGAALVLAGLCAQGTTLVEGTHHIERGYEQVERKLVGVGADIRRYPVETRPPRVASPVAG